MTTTNSIDLDCAAVAEHAAREVGPMLLEGFRSGTAVDLKVDFHDMVTEYDRAAEVRIREVVTTAFPGSTIVGEEAGAQGGGEPTWYVDPIDGTSNFARGIAFWCVSIAAAVDGEVVAGVIYDPVHDHLFRADGTGAQLNDEPLGAVGRTEEEGATILTHYPMPADLAFDREASLERYGRLVSEYGAVRNLSSGALCLAHVAAGWADGTFNFGTNAWDVAAGSHILRRAGGTYSTYADGRRMPEAQDHLRPHYLGTVEGARFPLIERILLDGSVGRP